MWFHRLHIICVFPKYQHVHCSCMLNLSVWNRFLITFLLQIIFNMYHMFFSTSLGTKSLNSAEMPLNNKQINKQTNKQTNHLNATLSC